MTKNHTPFTSVLVANRGEIAMRVMRTARQQGMRIVAVYTQADAQALHTKFADEAVCIGEGPVGDSYLSIDKILDAAKQTGAEAIHPGYGFLSESAAFAQACEQAGLVFIGPSAEAIELMGNKAAAKRRMLAAKVPCVPGYEGEDQSLDVLVEKAQSIGFPLMVKAAAGGGGRGMRLVQTADTLENGIQMARSEAENAFGNGELILEKAIIRPRHVEVQVFADRQGNTVHLAERDCSVQRRHQKVVEEAPCPVMTPALRMKMGEAAVDAAKSIGYEGAGTVEFLLDESGAFYFLEMNTRLQVEHPVTELVTDMDLVALQLSVAAGQPLGFDQADVTLSGHAMEVRLYAEDPTNGFLPASGHVALWQEAVGDGIRIDAGVVTNQSVSPFYDPMLAKIIAYGVDRDEARLRLIDALKKTVLFGVPNNRDFLIEVLERQAFIDGEATTAFIEQEFSDEDFAKKSMSTQALALAAALVFEKSVADAKAQSLGVSDALIGWSSQGRLTTHLKLAEGPGTHNIQLNPKANGGVLVHVGDCKHLVLRNNRSWRVDGELQKLVAFEKLGDLIFMALDDKQHELSQIHAASALANLASGGEVRAPMHGLLLEVCVEVGDAVAAGDKVAVLEAMKMQHELCAEIDGEVTEIGFETGTQVKADDLLVVVKGAVEA
ncbi:MAG: acetyl/propionyl/methylcrotonyl-CoA carboxylase subunit alpha [Alphaproteobacteria bacterium]